MPIRLNLLAEAQTAEDMRRRDPVKRVIAFGILAVLGMIAWSSVLQVKVLMANRDLSQEQFGIDTSTNAYQAALASQAEIATAKKKIFDLQKLTNARLLQGNLLNALQKVSVDNVQLMRIKVDQSYVPSGKGAKVATATERIVVTLDARDSSANPGDQVGKYKAALATQPYFSQMLGPTNSITLTDESSPQTDAEGKDYVLFTLECRLPDKTR